MHPCPPAAAAWQGSQGVFKEDEIDASAGRQQKASDFPPQPELRLATGHRDRMLRHRNSQSGHWAGSTGRVWEPVPELSENNLWLFISDKFEGGRRSKIIHTESHLSRPARFKVCLFPSGQ